MLASLTPEFFDTLVLVVIILGLAFAVVRLYADFTRPLPDEQKPSPSSSSSTRSISPSESSPE